MKIDWRQKYKEFTLLLQEGVPVKDTAERIGVSYNALCRILRELSMKPDGKFKERVAASTRLNDYIEHYILKEYNNLPQILIVFGLTNSRFQYMMKKAGLRTEWNLVDSTSENVAVGRKAELFIKGMLDFKIIKDAIKKDSKSPYDLIVRELNEKKSEDELIRGAVDVKATKLRDTEHGTRFKFNVSSATCPGKSMVKYVFCVGYDPTYTKEMALWVIPRKDIKGVSSVSISWSNHKTNKYSKYLYRVFDRTGLNENINKPKTSENIEVEQPTTTFVEQQADL